MEPILCSNPINTHLSSVLSSKQSKILLTDYRGRNLTGKEIVNYIDTIALDLLSRGIQQKDRVVFLAQPSIESILYFFALTRIGAVIVLADPEMGQQNFIDRITFSEARFILQDPILEKIDRFSFVKPILRMLHIWFPDNLPIARDHKITIKSLSVIKKLPAKSFKEEPLSEDTDLAIIFTSGTTGTPKGVVHSYKSLFAGIKIICDGIPIASEDYIYASQIYFLLIGLNIPARVYVPKPKKFNAKKFLQTVEREKITSTFLLPYEGQQIFSECKKQSRKIPSSLKTLLFGSAPVTKTFLSRLQTVCNADTSVYG
ncbi:MAG: AMP-binding protein, partial [Patescibacteria group bacterium]